MIWPISGGSHQIEPLLSALQCAVCNQFGDLSQISSENLWTFQTQWQFRTQVIQPQWVHVIRLFYAFQVLTVEFHVCSNNLTRTEARAFQDMFDQATRCFPTVLWFSRSSEHSLAKYLIWAGGAAWLARAPRSNFDKLWHSRINGTGLFSKDYTQTWCEAQFGVYIYVSPGKTKVYVGSTEATLLGRYDTRVRKLLQLRQRRLVSCEVALRWWNKQKNFQSFIPILIRMASSKHDALAMEVSDIQVWQPNLNYPWVLKLYNFKTTGTSNLFSIKRAHEGSKLFRRYRHIQDSRSSSFIKKQQSVMTHRSAWRRILGLGSFTFQRFKTSRDLRRKCTSSTTVYILLRMSKFVDEPYKSRAIKELHNILRYKELPVPRYPAPLILPPLIHPSFLVAVKKFLVTLIRDHSEALIPCHWPSSTVVEGKHMTIARFLHNWKQSLAQWSLQPPNQCRCNSLLEQFPDLPTIMVDQKKHIAGGFTSSFLPKDIMHFSDVNTTDAFYPAKEAYFRIAETSFKKWLDSNSFPGQFHSQAQDRWASWIEDQWTIHMQALNTAATYCFDHIQKIKKLFEGMIFHCEDHAADKLSMFCPGVYYRMVDKTFQDKAVFRACSMSPAEVHASMCKQYPQRLKRKYPWGADFTQPLPYAYILPKSKKLFTTARPILGYSATPLSKIFMVLGRVLTDILQIAYPSTFGHRTLPECFADLHVFFGSLGETRIPVDFNDDLKGFFTSVEHVEIRAAVRHAIHKYLEKQPTSRPLEHTYITVDLKAPTTARCIRGRSFSNSTHTFAVAIADIFLIVDQALDSNQFTCLGKVFAQTRGASIGAQASPAICATVTAFREQVWLDSYNVQLADLGFFLRYVDNRLMFLFPEFVHLPFVQQLVSLEFYKLPIELENCGNKIILGCEYDQVNKTCKYVPPEHAFQYRSVYSAGTKSRALCGFQARLHLLYRYTYPRSLAYELVKQLKLGYLRKGFTHQDLNVLVRKVAHKYRIARAQ